MPLLGVEVAAGFEVGDSVGGGEEEARERAAEVGPDDAADQGEEGVLRSDSDVCGRGGAERGLGAASTGRGSGDCGRWS